MQRLFAIFLLLCALLSVTMLVAAADPPKPGEQERGKPTEPPGQQKKAGDDKVKGPHSVSGTVTAKDKDTFTVSTKKGDSVVVKVLKSTRFQIPAQKDASFEDLEIGDRVAANGTPTNTGMDAKKVGIIPGKPTVQHRVGTVDKYDAGKSITIKTAQGTIETFTVTGETEIRGKATIAPGDRVTIVSRRDPSTRQFTARAIVVQAK